jgi:hypothetical protein
VSRATALLLLLLLTLQVSGLSARANDVRISYQGVLKRNNSAVSGNYDFEFTLFDDDLTGNSLGAFATNNVAVAAGAFRTELVFPDSPFLGQPLWLQIAVRPGGSAVAFTTLTPRQELTMSPGAVYSLKSGNAATADIASTVANGAVGLQSIGPDLRTNLVLRSGPESGLVVNAAGQLLSPTNFFSANSPALQAELLTVEEQMRVTIPGIYYVSTNGDDATALEGRIDRPWRSISNAVAAARPVNATVRVLPGTYGVYGQRLITHLDDSRAGVTISGKTNFVLEGVGVATLHNLEVGDIVMIEKCDNVTVRGLRIGYAEKPAATNLYDGGPSLFGVVAIRGFNHNITLRDLDIFNYPDHGLGTHHDTGFTDGLRILNVHSSHSGTFNSPAYTYRGDGNVVTIFNMANVLIDGLVAEDYFRGIEFFEYDNSKSGVTNVVVQNSFFLRGLNMAVVMLTSPATSEKFQNVRFDNILVDGVQNDGVTVPWYLPCGFVVGGCRGFRILNSEIRNVSIVGNPSATENCGVLLQGDVVDFKMRQCKISRCGTGFSSYDFPSLSLAPPRNLVLDGNDIRQSVGHGMRLAGRNVLVTGNVLVDNGQVWSAAGILWSDLTFSNSIVSGDAIFEGNWFFNTDTNSGQDVGLWIDSTNQVTLGKNYSGDNLATPVFIPRVQNATYESSASGKLPAASRELDLVVTDTGPQPLSPGRLVPAQSIVRGATAVYEARGRYSSGATPGNIRFRLRDSLNNEVFTTGNMPLPASATDLGWELKAYLRTDGQLGLTGLVTGRADLDRGDGQLVSRIVPRGPTPIQLDPSRDQVLVLDVILDTAGNSIRLESESIFER